MATGQKESRSIPGNHGVRVPRRVRGDEADFLLLSLRDSMDAIRAFAGDDVERAVYDDEGRTDLRVLEPMSARYDGIADP